MTNKQYRLPKEFATKWVAALRSGEYRQGREFLKHLNNWCCIGVAASICGVVNFSCRAALSNTARVLDNSAFGLLDDQLALIPKELKGDVQINRLVWNLVNLNDGQGASFTEIANWIESNCEFYE